jgi:hypothetical protein
VGVGPLDEEDAMPTREENALAFVNVLRRHAETFAEVFLEIARAEHLSKIEKVEGIRELVERTRTILAERVPHECRRFFGELALDAIEAHVSSDADRAFMSTFIETQSQELARRLLALAAAGDQEANDGAQT